MARKMAVEGTSISVGGASFSLYKNIASTPITFTAFATNGATIANIISRVASVDAVYSPGDLNLLTIEFGANDFQTGLQATHEAALENLFVYCDARRAVGWKVIMGTLLSESSAHTTYLAARAYINPLIRAAVNVRIDAIIDWAADPIIGPDAAGNDTSLYSDGIHVTSKGSAIMALVIRKTLNTFISPTQRKFRLI